MKKLALVLTAAGLIPLITACGGPSGGAVGVPDGQPSVSASIRPRTTASGPGPEFAAASTPARPPDSPAVNASDPEPTVDHGTSPDPSIDPGADPGADPVFATHPVLKRNETYTYRHTKPGDHSLPPGTFTLRYDVSTAGGSPLRAQVRKARDAIAKGNGIAIYLDGGSAVNDIDLAVIQSLHQPESKGGLGLTSLTRLYIYNLRSLQGGKECTPTSGLACAGQIARGGRSPYLWHNGWWESWVRHLTLDDLEEVKAGSFSNHTFESVSLRAARSIGVMGFGHGPYAKLGTLYLPSVTRIGRDAVRRNQYLVMVNLPKVTTIDDYAFDDASRLRYFNAPRLRSIGRNALNDTHALTSVNLPRLEYIGINCFDLNGDAQRGTGVRVLRLPKLTVLDKNGLVGFGSLRRVYAPSLTTAWHDAMTGNPSLEVVYAPKLGKLGPRVFRNNPNLRVVHFGERPPTQEDDVFVGTDSGKLTIYYSGDSAAWASFVPAGNPSVPVVRVGA